MSNQTPSHQESESTAIESQPFANAKPTVIGLYGLPGSGKTFLLNQLKDVLTREGFTFYEGSEVIASIVPGGLNAFKTLDEGEKTRWRQRAIDKIGIECANEGRAGVVAGHFMFWPENEEAGCAVYTENDLDTFTHILYLDIPADEIASRHLKDTERIRQRASSTHLHHWQEAEKTQLRDLCRQHGILFSLLSPEPNLLGKTLTLLIDFRLHSDTINLARAKMSIDEAIETDLGRLETVLVMDADRTLAAEDTGDMFWEVAFRSRGLRNEDSPLKKLFGGPLGYSYTALRQATLLYEEIAEDRFDTICEDIASTVIMHHEFVSLLRQVADKQHVKAVVVTCGLRRVWEKVLKKEDLFETVKVIGGGRISDDFVVTAAVKAALVTRLQDTHNLFVWAFGDSPLDLEMLGKANRAIVVVGEKGSRSKTMDEALTSALRNGLWARQLLLPSSATPRLDKVTLPLVRLTEQGLLDSILCRPSQDSDIQVPSCNT